MASNPSHLRAPNGGTRQIMTDLGYLNERTMPDYVKKYKGLAASSYILKLEAQGALKRADNNKISYWTQKGKNVPSFKVAALVTGSGAGADITVTVASGYHQSGLSPVAPGHYFRNDTTGQVYKVISVNSTAPTAHTAVLRITDETLTASIATADVLIFAPTVVGEASGSQETILATDEKLTNYMASIKTTMRFTDWSLMEETDIKGLWKPKQMARENERFIYQQEDLLMFGKPFTNIADATNLHKGLVPLVQEFGQSDTSSTAINEAYFQNQARLIDAEGYANEYDALMHINYRQRWETAVAGLFPNGAIEYNSDGSKGPLEVARNFKSFDIYGIKTNALNYDYFSSAKMAGAPINTGIYNNACLMIPKGEGVDPDGFNVPRLQIRWNQAESDSPILMRATGGLSPNKTNDIEELVISHVAHKGVQPFGLQGFLWMKPAFV